MSEPMKVVASTGILAIDTTTYRTDGTIFPLWENGVRNVIIVNAGAVNLLFKIGPSTGPDANNVTDEYPQMVIPAGQTHTYARSQRDSHWYAYAASSCNACVMSGTGM